MTGTLWQGPVVDAHHHFWDPKLNLYPWLEPGVLVPHRYGDYSSIKRRYYPEDFERDGANHQVVESVYVDAEWDPKDPIGETRYVHSLAQSHGRPHAMVAQAWLHQEDAAAVLAEQASFPLVRSVRHKPGGPDHPDQVGQTRSLMSDERWRRGYAALAPNGLHFDLQTPWWNLHEAIDLLRTFPETTLILNHAGLPGDRSEAGLKGWHTAMSALAEAPNVAVKISGICVPGQPWTADANRWIVREIIAMFGANRAMVGSNFPVDGMCDSYDTIFSGLKTILSDLPDDAQEQVFCGTARHYYRTQSSPAHIAHSASPAHLPT